MFEKYEDTIDWNSYWLREKESSRMIKSARNMARRISIFIDKYNLRDIADYGCGTGRTLFILSEKYPHIDFTGFDSSMSVIKKNRLNAKKMGFSNIRFKHGMLPNIKTDQRFDLVMCIATLHYIKDIGKAIRNLYYRVNNDGVLIFNYPNRYSKYWYQNWIKPKESEKKKRFSLVLSGKNLLTLTKIENILGNRPRNFWKTVGENIGRENMCVYLHKG